MLKEGDVSNKYFKKKGVDRIYVPTIGESLKRKGKSVF